MTFNLDLAVTMLARIELGQLDNTWDQARWAKVGADGAPVYKDGSTYLVESGEDGLPINHSCGTAHCAAGFVLDSQGIRLQWQWAGWDGAFHAWTTANGDNIADKAMGLLGIKPPDDWDDDTYFDEHWDYGNQVPLMFNASAELDDIYSEVFHYADGLVSTKEALIDLVTERIVALTQARVARPTPTHPV